MVDPNELRLGNLVKCLVHLPIGFNTPALSYSPVKELREEVLETNGGFYKYRDVSPLTLTEEILIDSGGEKVSDTLIKFVDSGVLDMYIVNDEGKFYLATEEGEKYSIRIDSVHHFQNLYYMIKDKEIKIRI